MCSRDLNLPYAEPPLGPEHSGSPIAPAARIPQEAIRSLGEEPRRRRKLWGIPAEYHCPIIGTCLHVEELRRLARKADCGLSPRSSDYEVHVRFVAVAHENAP